MKVKRLTLIILIALSASLFAVGSYFLLDNFTTADDAPLTDPLTTSGGQSVDVVDVEGLMSIAGGVLTVPAQASAVNGEEGLRYATEASQYMGRAFFFKVKFSTLANGISGTQANSANAFGFTYAANIVIGNSAVAVRTDTARFLWRYAAASATTDVVPTLTRPTTTDSFYIAVGLGGRSGTAPDNMNPWYSGQLPSSYVEGAFLWIKKNVGGNWLLEGVHNDEVGATIYALLSNYSSAFTLDRWAVSNDTLRTLMQPLHYTSGTGADGTQLFDITPEVGAAFDSVKGDFQISSNQVIAAGADPGSPNWLTTTDLADDDVYIETAIDIHDATSDVTLVLRRDSGDGSFIAVIATNASDVFNIATYDGASFTTRATTAVTFPITAGLCWMAAAAIDSTIHGWVWNRSASFYTTWKGTTALTNIGKTEHGLRLTDAISEVTDYRAYPLGTDGEYNTLSQYFTDAIARQKIIFIQ